MSAYTSIQTAAGIAPGMIGHKPIFDSIPVDTIISDPGRLRSVDPRAVEMLARSIDQNGQLQPIAVRVNQAWRDAPAAHDNERYILVYGAQRTAAIRSLLEAALRDGDESQGCRFAKIQAFVFPEDTPPEFMQRFEIVENLHRTELTQDERSHWTVKLAGLFLEERSCLKKSDNSRSENSKPRNPKEGRPKGVIAEVAETLGIDQNAVRKRLKKFAKDLDLPLDLKASEAVLKDQIDRILEKAPGLIESKKTTRADEGKDYSSRLRPGSPRYLINWIRLRVADGAMTPANVAAYRDGLIALAKELGCEA